MPEFSVDLDYPVAVHLETWTQCNAACNFCPYPTLDRKGNKMSGALIEKILTDLEDIPKQQPFYFSPFKVNEPFLDKRLIPMLEDVNQRLPNAIIRLFSNGTPITEKKLDRIAKLKNVSHLWISLNDHRPKEYEEVMQLPLHKTLKKLDLLHRKKLEWFPHNVIISRVCDLTEADIEFESWANDRYPAFSVILIKRESWLDFHDHAAIEKEVPASNCMRWNEIDITSSGVVSLCCMDGRAQYPIGDVSKDHVLEVFNSPGYRRMREGAFNRQAYDPCKRCTYAWLLFSVFSSVCHLLFPCGPPTI